MNHTTTAELLNRMFEMFSDGTPTNYGTDAYLDLVADDCDWAENSGDSRFAGRRGGKAELRAGGTESATTLRNRKAVVREHVVEGDRAAVNWTWSATDTRSGAVTTAEVNTYFTVREGLITRWHDWITS